MVEQARLSALYALDILDSDPEPFFDAITRAAQASLGMPIALIAFVDDQRQWFKSQAGFDCIRETPRDISFCHWAILSGDVFEIEDASVNAQFAGNPLVAGPPYVRHYVGAPIEVEGGSRVGTLCLLSPKVGRLTTPQISTLQCLAQVVATGLDQRAKLLKHIERGAELCARLKKSQAFLRQTHALAKVGGWELNPQTDALDWSEGAPLIYGLINPARTLESAICFCSKSAQLAVQSAMVNCINTGAPMDLVLPSTTASMQPIWVHLVGQRVQDERGTRLIGAIQDVTQNHAANSALENSERLYRRLFQYSMGLICTHTLDGIITSINPAAALSLGRKEHDLINRPLSAFLPPERRAKFESYLSRIKADQSDTGTMELIASDGSRRIWAYQNVLDAEADPPYVLGHAQDITAQHFQEQQLQELAVRDPLTRCFNRRYLSQLSHLHPPGWGCLIFDLDHFKEINDTYGHVAGDNVLVGFVAFLERKLVQGEVVIRLGGDEFLVFIPSPAVKRVKDLEDSYQSYASEAPIRFSGGSAVNRQDESFTDTINRADMKLYDRRKVERLSSTSSKGNWSA